MRKSNKTIFKMQRITNALSVAQIKLNVTKEYSKLMWGISEFDFDVRIFQSSHRAMRDINDYHV